MKKIRAIIFLSLFFMISATIGAYASTAIQKVEAFLRSDFQLFINGEKQEVEAILVYNDRSYLPVREVSELLGVDVDWQESNKGIYINQRYPGQPDREIKEDLEYDEINFNSPTMYKVNYLGKEEMVLVNMSDDWKEYYREKDLNYIGLDTRGVRKAIESMSEQFYIAKDEAAKLWKETPKFTPVYGELEIMGEKDEDRIKRIDEFIKSIPITEALLRGEEWNQYNYYVPPTVYMAEALPNYEYHLLTYQNGVYSWYWLRLDKNVLDRWILREHTKKTYSTLPDDYFYY